MSHFTCLVIGPDFQAQLAPYHEFECTGRDDQYVKDVDRTDEARAEYESQTKTMARNEATGEVAYAYDDRFCRPFTAEERAKIHPCGTGCGGGLSWCSKDWGDGSGYEARVHELPAGWVKQSVPLTSVETFAEFVEGWYGSPILRTGEERTDEHKYGWVEVDDKGEVIRVIKRTNDQARWDWYTVGGRWTGFFPLKNGKKGATGKPGLMTKPADAGTADQVRKGSVDFERARREAAGAAHLEFDVWEECFTKHGRPEAWSSFASKVKAEELKIEEARTLYHAQPTIAAWQEHGRYECPVDGLGFDRAAYVQRERNGACVPHAIVKDGKWVERGSMGWFGIVSNAKDNDEWDAEVQRLYDDLPDDTLLTLVDCHI